MNIEQINFTTIEKSTLSVLYPFIYDKNKVLSINENNIVSLKNEYLKDFLPYAKNFFGTYHFSQENINIGFPRILKNDDIKYITFQKDKKLTTKIQIESIKAYLFKGSIGLLNINYQLQENLSGDDYLYYHYKLSTIEKRNKQNLITSNNKEFKYYFEFINELISNYTNNFDNISQRSNIFTYNTIITNNADENNYTTNFLEALVQYRSHTDTLPITKLSSNHITQTSNTHTIGNENVILHVGIKSTECDNNFIENEFFKKYSNNHFLTYITALYQICKVEQLIIKAFSDDRFNQDLEKTRDIKKEILDFLSYINFTKISNNSIRNNLYKFYRKTFDINSLIQEIYEVSEKISSELEQLEAKKIDKRFRSYEYFGIGAGIVALFLSEDFRTLLENIYKFLIH